MSSEIDNVTNNENSMNKRKLEKQEDFHRFIESKERFVEEKLLREKFKEYLIEKMGISIRESEKILCEVREQYLK